MPRPPTFFVVRAHAARERDDRDGAQEAVERALAHGLLEQPRGPTWTMSLTGGADIGAWLEDRPTAALLLDLLVPIAQVMTWQYGPSGASSACSSSHSDVPKRPSAGCATPQRSVYA
jgi:hypothetical protein